MTAVTAPERVERMPQPPAARPLAWLRERGMGASILVAAISSAFGALLLTATGYLAAIMDADPYIGDSETLAAVLVIMTVILVGVAVYVAIARHHANGTAVGPAHDA